MLLIVHKKFNNFIIVLIFTFKARLKPESPYFDAEPETPDQISISRPLYSSMAVNAKIHF